MSLSIITRVVLLATLCALLSYVRAAPDDGLHRTTLTIDETFKSTAPCPDSTDRPVTVMLNSTVTDVVQYTATASPSPTAPPAHQISATESVSLSESLSTITAVETITDIDTATCGSTCKSTRTLVSIQTFTITSTIGANSAAITSVNTPSESLSLSESLSTITAVETFTDIDTATCGPTCKSTRTIISVQTYTFTSTAQPLNMTRTRSRSRARTRTRTRTRTAEAATSTSLTPYPSELLTTITAIETLTDTNTATCGSTCKSTRTLVSVMTLTLTSTMEAATENVATTSTTTMGNPSTTGAGTTLENGAVATSITSESAGNQTLVRHTRRTSVTRTKTHTKTHSRNTTATGTGTRWRNGTATETRGHHTRTAVFIPTTTMTGTETGFVCAPSCTANACGKPDWYGSKGPKMVTMAKPTCSGCATGTGYPVLRKNSTRSAGSALPTRPVPLLKRTLPQPANYPGGVSDLIVRGMLTDGVPALFSRSSRAGGTVMQGVSSALKVDFRQKRAHNVTSKVRSDAVVFGLYGCTTVIITSQKGMWMGYFYESPSFSSGQDVFRRDVLDAMRKGDQTYDGDGNRIMPGINEEMGAHGIFSPNTTTTAVILTVQDPTTKQPLFKNYVDQIAAELPKFLPNYKAGGDNGLPAIATYMRKNPADANNEGLADGKALFQYDPHEMVHMSPNCPHTMVQLARAYVMDYATPILEMTWLRDGTRGTKKEIAAACSFSAASSLSASKFGTATTMLTSRSSTTTNSETTATLYRRW